MEHPISQPPALETVPKPVPEEEGERFNVGYVVGLTRDKEVVCEVFGKNQDVFYLLGLHEHAGIYLHKLHDMITKQGTTVMLERLEAITSILRVMMNTLGQLGKMIKPAQQDEPTDI